MSLTIKTYFLVLFGLLSAPTFGSAKTVPKSEGVIDDIDAKEIPESIAFKKQCALEWNGNIAGRIPAELTLELTVNYEENFLLACGGDHQCALDIINEVLKRVQDHYYDEDLQTRITMKVPT